MTKVKNTDGLVYPARSRAPRGRRLGFGVALGVILFSVWGMVVGGRGVHDSPGMSQVAPTPNPDVGAGPVSPSSSPALSADDQAGSTGDRGVDILRPDPIRWGEALRLLSEIEVKGKAPKTGYSREVFGQRWSDDVTVEYGHNGCDTRNDILKRDLTSPTFKPGTRECVVTRGILHDPYTGRIMEFERGPNSAQVQIDHVVSLHNAWLTGAQALNDEERRNFANDPRNLLAVDGFHNQAKGAGDAATWLPPNKSFRCTYVSQQIEVKHAYLLWVTDAEHNAMQRVLTGCLAGDSPPSGD